MRSESVAHDRDQLRMDLVLVLLEVLRRLVESQNK